MGLKVAVAGATGGVGREVLTLLAERAFPAAEVIALASGNSAGREVSFGEDDILKIQDLGRFDFSAVDLVLSCVDGPTAKAFVPKAAKAGALVVDASEAFRLEPGVPLVVAEVNPEDLEQAGKKNIVACPAAVVTQIALCLKPLHAAFGGVRRVVASTYHSASAGGREAMDELFNQTRGIYVNQPVVETRSWFPKQIAFNVIPQVEAFTEAGATAEEQRLGVEMRKLIDPDLALHANCAWVGGFVGIAAWLNVETLAPISDAAAREVLRDAPGVSVVDHRVEEGYATPAEVAGEDAVFVSRLRADRSVDNGISLWCVADNLHRGSALNMVQIAELIAAGHG